MLWGYKEHRKLLRPKICNTELEISPQYRGGDLYSGVVRSYFTAAYSFSSQTQAKNK